MTSVHSATVAVGTTTLEINLDHDCHTDAISSDIVYRRSDDPSNQNLYRTTGDTGTATQTLHLTRGSSDVYAVGAADDEVVSGGYVQSTSVFTFGGNPSTITAASDEIFVNGHGPLTVTDVTTTAVTVSAASDAANIFTNGAGATQTDLTQTNGAYPAYKTATMTGVAASTDSQTVTSSKKVDLPLYSKILVGTKTHEDFQSTVKTAAVSDNTAISISDGGNRGGPTDAFNGVSNQALYQVLHTTGYIGTVVTESASGTTFQYVSQCSNRGTCDSSTGICKCFKGYSNDNCDNQNMLAM